MRANFQPFFGYLLSMINKILGLKEIKKILGLKEVLTLQGVLTLPFFTSALFPESTDLRSPI